MYDLEKEIGNWLTQLRKNPGFEDGDIVEIEDHIRDNIEYELGKGRTPEEALRNAISSFGSQEVMSDEMIKSRTASMKKPRKHQFEPIETNSMNPITQQAVMMLNYLKVAIRNFNRNRLYSSINVFGLALGMALCLTISFWVQRELSYDNFHKKADRIYRLERTLFRDNAFSRWPITSYLYRDGLIDDFPEIENATRIWRRGFVVKDKSNNTHRQELYAADNSIFKIFDFKLDEGNPESALADPLTIVLTRERAKLYFGTDDVIGSHLQLEWQGKWTDFKITGLLEEVPQHSHIHFNMLVSMSSYPDTRFENWRSNYLYTYVLARENTIRSDLETKLRKFVKSRLEVHYGDLTGPDTDIHDVLKLVLFPITDIHLDPSPNYEIEAGGNRSSVFIFVSIALSILAIACLNFINLSTARANHRALEVGLRKTFGANRRLLRSQFIMESILLAVAAYFIAILMVFFLVPTYNKVFGDEMTLDSIMQLDHLIVFLIIAIAVGFVSGIYPAFFLTRFKPIQVLQKKFYQGSKRSAFRRNLVVIQFIISIILIIGVLTVSKQMQFIGNTPLGFDKENMVLIEARGEQIPKGYAAFRNELLQNPQIASVSGSYDVPGDRFFSNTYFSTIDDTEGIMMQYMTVGYDFIENYNINLIAGRSFSRDLSTDTAGVIILNEAAVKRIGWNEDEAINRKLSAFRDELKIVGVVTDFNFKSVHTEIEPLVLILYPEGLNRISVRVQSGETESVLEFIRQTWDKVYPGEQLAYGFLDDRISQHYQSEKKMQSLFVVFSSLSIFVACLGLFGLAAFIAETRLNEIAIRKVLGASPFSAIMLLSKDVIKWMIIANILAIPIGWLVMNEWLRNFVYRVEIGWVVFLVTFLITMIIALTTFSLQAIRAAYANPVDSIAYQ